MRRNLRGGILLAGRPEPDEKTWQRLSPCNSEDGPVARSGDGFLMGNEEEVSCHPEDGTVARLAESVLQARLFLMRK